MKKFYLAGQQHFGNRGCEALVRSTAIMLNETFGKVDILCPSLNPTLDARQWPQAADLGVRFVQAVPYPAKLRWWYRAVRAIPSLKSAWIPRAYHVPTHILQDVKECDAVIQIGGDNFTLDYTPAGLIGNTAFSEMLMARGLPNVLWAASVGPFSKDSVIERYMQGFLHRLSLITIRESVTADYLKSIGVTANVRMVGDPAFLMPPEPFDVEPLLPRKRGNGVLGLNFSPLVARFGKAPSDALAVQEEIVQFVQEAQARFGLSIMFVPHVDPLDGTPLKSDSAFMSPLFARLTNLGDNISLAPRNLNAAQLKYLISQCRYFMGARTHSTIAGFSTGVPTASIAYSIKALGLNRDIFGHERYVIPTKTLTASSLSQTLQTLIDEESSIRSHLETTVPEIRQRSKLSAILLAETLG